MLTSVPVFVPEIHDFLGSLGQMIRCQMAVSEQHGVARPATELH
jgi:hypothetical protein